MWPPGFFKIQLGWTSQIANETDVNSQISNWNWSVQMCCYKFASLQSELQDCHISIYFLDYMITQKRLLYLCMCVFLSSLYNTENHAENVPFAVSQYAGWVIKAQRQCWIALGRRLRASAPSSDLMHSRGLCLIPLVPFVSLPFAFLIWWLLDPRWQWDESKGLMKHSPAPAARSYGRYVLCWAWPAHINSPKARSPFLSIALFAYIYVPTSATLLISSAFLLFPLNFPPFLPVAAINLEKG